jgi:hypothetical protein
VRRLASGGSAQGPGRAAQGWVRRPGVQWPRPATGRRGFGGGSPQEVGVWRRRRKAAEPRGRARPLFFMNTICSGCLSHDGLFRQPQRSKFPRKRRRLDTTRRLRLYCQTGGIGEERFAYRELYAMPAQIFCIFYKKSIDRTNFMLYKKA